MKAVIHKKRREYSEASLAYASLLDIIKRKEAAYLVKYVFGLILLPM